MSITFFYLTLFLMFFLNNFFFFSPHHYATVVLMTGGCMFLVEIGLTGHGHKDQTLRCCNCSAAETVLNMETRLRLHCMIFHLKITCFATKSQARHCQLFKITQFSPIICTHIGVHIISRMLSILQFQLCIHHIIIPHSSFPRFGIHHLLSVYNSDYSIYLMYIGSHNICAHGIIHKNFNYFPTLPMLYPFTCFKIMDTIEWSFFALLV